MDSLGPVMLTLGRTRRVVARITIMTDAASNLPVFDGPDGLVPAVAQDAATGRVLMIAYMNREAWEETLRTGRAVYYSRSRRRLWRKGEVSGNFQQIREVYVDCDGDAVLLKVDQVGGAACHEGYPSCFYREVKPTGIAVVEQRVFDPGQVYRQDLD